MCHVYLVLYARDAYEEDQTSRKEADAKVQMDGGSWAFDGANQGEC